MSTVQIEFVNFFVFVIHNDGVVVIPGADDHTLVFQDETGETSERAVKGDVSLSIVKDGREVPPTRTAPQGSQFLPDVAFMLGRDVTLSRARVFGDERADQNSRILLKGGRLNSQEARPESGGSNRLAHLHWDFTPLGARDGGLHQISNRVLYERDASDGEFVLTFADGTTVPVRPDAPVRFINRDNTNECTKPTEGIDHELPGLLKALGITARATSRVAERDREELNSLLASDPGGPPAGSSDPTIMMFGGKTCKPCLCVRTEPVIVETTAP